MSRTTHRVSVVTALATVALAATAVAAPGVPSVDGTSPITGRKITTAAFKGKPVVFTVWASWCPECNGEAPTVAKVSAKHQEVRFVGIDVSDKPSDAKGFYKKYGWTFASIDDPKRERQFKLGLPGQPSTIFVNAAGNVVGKVIGAASEQQFEQGIAAAKKR